MSEHKVGGHGRQGAHDQPRQVGQARGRLRRRAARRHDRAGGIECREDREAGARFRAADLRLPRAHVRRGQDPRRLLQARGPPHGEGDAVEPADRPSDPSAAPQAVDVRDPGHGDRRVLGPGARCRRAGADRRFHVADAVRHSVPRARRRGARGPRGRPVGRVAVVVAGTANDIIMVGGGSREVTEADMIAALDFAMQNIRRIVAVQNELAKVAGKPKRPVVEAVDVSELEGELRSRYTSRLRDAIRIPGKDARQEELDIITKDAVAALAEKYGDKAVFIGKILHDVERDELREMILRDGVRSDGRKGDQIRPITIEVGVLPRTHGSCLFTRGETQALVVTTLGTKSDEQRVEELEGQSWKSYMLHYNFPPFSVGETRPIRGPGRREIGHGALAERAVEPVIPADTSFPYTIRIVSDILESNGSSSMASVCGASMSLMDAGVPVKAPVAGVAMGLIKEGDRVAVLTDILGVEDHLGDMDFKVTGTTDGITAFQMDTKIGEWRSATARSCRSVWP